MIIDFHTHTFPEKIAAQAIDKLSDNSGSKPYTNGMMNGLLSSMKKAGIDIAVVLPVATSPTQYETINRVAILTNEDTDKTGVLSFGGIHPDNENYKDILTSLKENGVKGIKLHPVYQRVNFDDIRMERIVDKASELGLITLVHSGYDIGFPGSDEAVPKRIANVLKDVRPEKLVLAHMGGWNCYDEVEDLIAGIWIQHLQLIQLKKSQDRGCLNTMTSSLAWKDLFLWYIYILPRKFFLEVTVHGLIRHILLNL